MASENERVFVDCRETPSINNCSLRIAGRPDEVFELAVYHTVTAHGHQDNEELRQLVRSSMKPERDTELREAAE